MNKIDEMLIEIKGSALPLMLFGRGTTTVRVIKYLKSRGVNIAGVLVNKPYFKIDEQIEGVAVYCFEDYLSDHTCDVIICTGDWKLDDFLPDELKHIEKVYAYDFWGLFAIDEWNYWDESFLSDHHHELDGIRKRLADQKSKDVFDENLKQRTTLCYSRKYDNPSLQYFDRGIIKDLYGDEGFVDCGAYHGENLIEYCRLLAERRWGGHLTAWEFEADPQNVVALKKNVADMGIVNDVRVIGKGVWNCNGFISLDDSESKSSKITDGGGIRIPVVRIDDTIEGDVTFIKMDIEGAELQALKGARETIKRNRPRMAISVYHRPSDFIEIPQFIMDLDLDYKFYLRCYSQTGCETILYAV